MRSDWSTVGLLRYDGVLIRNWDSGAQTEEHLCDRGETAVTHLQTKACQELKMPSSIRVANKIPQTGRLINNRNLFSQFWRWKEIRVPVWLGEGLLLGCTPQILSLRGGGGGGQASLCNSFYKDMNPIHEGFAFMTYSPPKGPTSSYHHLQLWFLCLFLCFREGEGREKERERNIDVRETHRSIASCTPQLGTWPATQAGALTGNRTCDLSVHRLAVNPLSRTSQDSTGFSTREFWGTQRFR